MGTGILLTTLEMEIDGEASFEMALEDESIFELYRYNSGSLLLEAVVTEKATQSTQKADVNVLIGYEDYRIQVDAESQSYLPGLPNRIGVSAIAPDGSYVDKTITVRLICMSLPANATLKDIEQLQVEVTEYYRDSAYRYEQYAFTVNTNSAVEDIRFSARASQEEAICCQPSFNRGTSSLSS